jgi:hypothetical protein
VTGPAGRGKCNRAKNGDTPGDFVRDVSRKANVCPGQQRAVTPGFSSAPRLESPEFVVAQWREWRRRDSR